MIYSFVVSFALGILIEKIFDFGTASGLFVLVLTLAISLIIFKENSNRTKIIFGVGLALSFGMLRMSLVDTSPNQNFYKSIGEKISFEARIVDEPDVRDEAVRYTVEPVDSKSKILLVANRFPQFKYHDQISVSGSLNLPKNFNNENGVEFDYLSYLAKDKIHFIIYQPQIEKIKSENIKIVSRLYELKNFLIKKITDVVPEPNASLVSGLLFGTKQSLGNELLTDFKTVGLIHIIVLSGYNITLIAVGIFQITAFFGKRNLGFVAGAIGIIIFSLMVGLGATVVRASIMALIGILARFLGRPKLALRSLFIAGLFMITWNPLILIWDPSFQLSFMATLGLILFSPIVYNFISQKIPFITTKLALREIVSSTLAVQIFILPILIQMSGSISLISFLVNPLVLPLVPLIMGLGGLTSFLGILNPILAWPVGIIAYLLTEFIIKIVELGASLPFVSLSVPTLSLYIIIIWYLFYAFIFERSKNSIPPLANLD